MLILLASSSFKRFICVLFEQLNSNWQKISIPLHSCLQCRLRPITSTLISPLRARKYHAIRENSRGKWPTVSSSFTACLSIGLLNSRLATSFSPIDGLQKRILGFFFFFFSKSCLKVGGAAYTRVFTVLSNIRKAL